MTKFYLFQDAVSKETHGVETRWASMGTFELDRLFGGGFSVLCGRKAGGAGVLSETLRNPGHITCKGCFAALKKRKVAVKQPPKSDVWPPETVRELDVPRILGIPGAAHL